MKRSMLWPSRAGWSGWACCAGLLFNLGAWTSLPSADLRSDEQVVFYPTAAWRVADGWEAELRGCVFEMEPRPVAVLLVRQALGVDRAGLTPEESALFDARLRLLLRDHKRGRTVTVQWIGSGPKPKLVKLGPSTAGGQFSARVRLTQAEVTAWADTNGCLHYEAVWPQNRSPRPAPGQVHLIEPTGWSVISDIDDTIKVTEVREWNVMLRNTLCRPVQPVPGMAQVYQTWARRQAARFHYVSAGPWQLYELVAELVQRHGFPPGPVHLRTVRVSDGTVLALLESPQQYKLQAIEPLLALWPQRRFVLVGDSGERDPEAYGALARRYPHQVARVFIRNVTDEPAEAERYRTAFAGLPESVWRVFKDPAEIVGALP